MNYCTTAKNQQIHNVDNLTTNTSSNNNWSLQKCKGNNILMFKNNLFMSNNLYKTLLIVLVVSIMVAGCSDKEAESSVNNEPLTNAPSKVVSSIVLGSKRLQNNNSTLANTTLRQPIIRTLSGQVVAAEKSNISFETNGRITKIYAKMGSRVNRGAVLAEIDDTNYQIKLSQAQSKINQATSQLKQANSQLRQAIDSSDKAKIDVKRREALIDIGAVSQTEVDSVRLAFRSANDQVQVANNQVQVAKDQVQVAKASLELLKKQFKDTRLVAPFSGVIMTQFGEVGQIASPSLPIFTIATDDNKEVRVTVPENLMMSIGVGQPMLVSFPALGVKTKGKVTEISSQAVAGSFPVTIHLEKPSSKSLKIYQAIRSGMTAEVAFQIMTPQMIQQAQLHKKTVNNIKDKNAHILQKALHSTFIVPPSAIGVSNNAGNKQGSYVYRIQLSKQNNKKNHTPLTGTLEKISVSIGDVSTNGMSIQSLSGDPVNLQAGDTIVRTGVSLLQEGQVVELMGSGSKRVNP